MRSARIVAGVWGVVFAAGCSVEPPGFEDETAASVDAENSPEEADSWEYQTFCWYDDDLGCRFDDGTPVGDKRVNCVDVEDVFACVTDALNDAAGNGWRLELGDGVFPQEHVVHLMFRPR